MSPTSSSRPAAPRIVVLGSLNMDLVLRVPHAPAAGETLLGRSFATIPGGKGANQAVSCAREGAQVRMIGCVGDDDHGRALRQALERDGIDTEALRTDAAEPTGTALIMVEDSGQNRIVMIAGANAGVDLDAADLRTRLAGAAFCAGGVPARGGAAGARKPGAGGLVPSRSAGAITLPCWGGSSSSFTRSSVRTRASGSRSPPPNFDPMRAMNCCTVMGWPLLVSAAMLVGE